MTEYYRLCNLLRADEKSIILEVLLTFGQSFTATLLPWEGHLLGEP